MQKNIKVTAIKVEKEYYFTDRPTKIAYDITIDNHHNKHVNSQIRVTSKFNDTGNDIIHNNGVLKELGHVYAKSINQYRFKYQLTFLVLVDK